ncbi:hypothetical protein GCM10011529_05850 [Polymorphobacter glacialis]|uniref:Flagellar protein FlgN n=1 Tax=Sandarakinorhabdus glacialis TaxID=1614636 RepID=A0A917E4A1_9SPHN|nr:hypothetical protein [Polymorphobacter glacialis]GGE02262.1 hypothetical protein GCM10011529_05850 [Polymorphobacter glacialis]
MAGASSFVRLVEAIRGELAALEAEDAMLIEAATAAKLAALQAVQADIDGGMPADRGLLGEARALNAEAALRARAKIITTEKRLAAVSVLAGRPAALVYGRDGRWA